MTYNTENTLMETKNFTLPEMLEGDFSNEELADDYAGLQLSFQRVKIPGGGSLQFEIPGDDPENPDYAKTIEGVIIYNHQASAYWPEGSEYDDTVTPLCSSVDGITGCGTPGGSCAMCELNKYGTGTDSKGNPSKGKACKNMRHLYILRDGEYTCDFRSGISSRLSFRRKEVKDIADLQRRKDRALVLQVRI